VTPKKKRKKKSIKKRERETLVSADFDIPGVSWNQFPTDTEGQLYFVTAAQVDQTIRQIQTKGNNVTVLLLAYTKIQGKSSMCDKESCFILVNSRLIKTQSNHEPFPLTPMPADA
jgi:hypothetical protein